jgi:type I restriction enzyme R subunit
MGLGEATTRRRLVDPKLKEAGWKIISCSEGLDLARCDKCAITEYPTDNGPADYALCVGDQILGIVEAKKLTLSPQGVLTQAERYARGLTTSSLSFRGYRVPFLYSTNGKVIWHHDIRDELNVSREIKTFHTPACLAERLERGSQQELDRLLATPNEHSRLRPYQVDANVGIEDAIARRKRNMLVAMATGTGKTFMMVNEVYRLMKSGLAKRVLFLVDRRALAAQAVRAFASFEPEPGVKFDQLYEVYSQRFHREDLDEDEKFDPKVLPSSYLLKPKSSHAFVYVCTIQRMTINLYGREAMMRTGDDELPDDDARRMKVPNHAFDVVVADECHRGYTAAELSIWRDTLDHFDAIRIGMTATPAAHTVGYFKNIACRYEYERAVREGYLVDYDAVSVQSDVRLNGIFLKEGELVDVVDTDTGTKQLDNMEDERQVDAEQVEQLATSPDSNRKILEEVKKYADQHEETCGRQPKILVFALHDLPHRSHADSLVTIARDVFGRGESYVRKITGRSDRPLQLIREFRNRPEPHVVVTVDMLSTGVDIPDLEFIVLLRPVKSRILFEQMLGRGTRKGEKYPDKSHFTVFDCFDGSILRYFKQSTGLTAEPPRPETRTIVQIIEDIWGNRDRKYNIGCLVKRLQRIDKEMSGEARELFARFIPDGDLGKIASDLPRLLAKDFKKTMAILRDKDFQHLLVNYPRPKPVFIIATENEDTVGSTALIRDYGGNIWKPSDYLTAFANFVRENPAHIEAVAILLNRPRGWKPEALTELKQKLAAAPPRFTTENLEAAHRLHYHKAMVDIISMVKRAAHEEEPLLTAEERVGRAMDKIVAGRTFTDEQQKWLDRIREHLVRNLSISRGDFDDIQVLSRPGGWARANQDFNRELDKLLGQINEAVAA